MAVNVLIINILVFQCLLHVSNPRVHLQEDGYIYSYGMVRFAFIGISSLIGRRLCAILRYATSYLHIQPYC